MRLLLLVSVLGILSSCKDDSSDCGDLKLSYNNEICTIFETACNNGDCHIGKTDGWAVLPEFSSYENLLPYLTNGLIDVRINTKDTTLLMPPYSREDRIISELNLEKLNHWICNGFPEG